MASPRLETDRLLLRPAAADDVDLLRAVWVHPEVRRFLWDDAEISRADASDVVERSIESFARDGTGIFVAMPKESGVATKPREVATRRRGASGGDGSSDASGPDGSSDASGPDASSDLVGFCGFWPFHEPPEIELLYGLARAHWGAGLATEMARAVLAYGFDTLGFEEVQASTDVPNEASIRVMQRLGMRLHRESKVAGHGTIYYRLRRGDFHPPRLPAAERSIALEPNDS